MQSDFNRKQLVIFLRECSDHAGIPVSTLEDGGVPDFEPYFT